MLEKACSRILILFCCIANAFVITGADVSISLGALQPFQDHKMLANDRGYSGAISAYFSTPYDQLLIISQVDAQRIKGHANHSLSHINSFSVRLGLDADIFPNNDFLGFNLGFVAGPAYMQHIYSNSDQSVTGIVVSPYLRANMYFEDSNFFAQFGPSIYRYTLNDSTNVLKMLSLDVGIRFNLN